MDKKINKILTFTIISLLTIGVSMNITNSNRIEEQITVSAKVTPFLAMKLERTDISFGQINKDSMSYDSFGIEVGTNAKNGVSVSVTSQEGGLRSNIKEHTIGLNTNSTEFDNEKYTFQSSLNLSDGVAGQEEFFLEETIINQKNQTVQIYSGNKPQGLDFFNYDFDFSVGTRIAEETPSGADYSDSLIFSVTGNF